MIIKQIVITGDTGIDYTIEADISRGVTCTCPDFAFRGATRACKHVVFVQENLVAGKS